MCKTSDVLRWIQFSMTLSVHNENQSVAKWAQIFVMLNSVDVIPKLIGEVKYGIKGEAVGEG